MNPIDDYTMEQLIDMLPDLEHGCLTFNKVCVNEKWLFLCDYYSIKEHVAGSGVTPLEAMQNLVEAVGVGK